MAFVKASKEKSKLRLALIGPSGSGKTYTALNIAKHLGKKIAVIDSERGSASKYADLFEFDTCDMENHAPQTFVRYIKEAEAAGYDVIVIDSLSHAWIGKEGALEQVDKAAKRSNSGNSFTAWRDVTPMHNELVDTILQSKAHVIATMRVKQEYVIEENEKGKKTPRKIGLAPVQRDGVEYEFDVIADMNIDHDLIVGKTRCHLVDGLVVRKPGKEFAETLRGWLETGAEKPPAAAAVSTQMEVQSPKQPSPDPKQTGKTDEKSALFAAAKANGWNLTALSEFLCSQFSLTIEQLKSDLTQEQRKEAFTIISRPENKNGCVVVNAHGDPLPAESCWPSK